MARFTEKGVERLKTTGKRYAVTEGEGLYLEVSAKGGKRWLYYYTYGDKRKWLPLGDYPAMSLKDARNERDTQQAKVSRGDDPLSALTAQPTVSELFEEWFGKATDKRGTPWSEGHKRNVRYMFAADVLPFVGDRKVSEITKRDIRMLLENIESRAPNQALQVYRRLSRFFSYAAQKDIIEFSPIAHLEPIGTTSRKTRYLTADEIKIFLDCLPGANMAPQTARILELILRTGQRPSEICGAHIDEMRDGFWVIPEHRAKNRTEHRVPMTETIKNLFGAPNENGLFFPSLTDAKTPVGHTVLSKALRRSIANAEKRPTTKKKQEITIPLAPFTPHDLRRTCATSLAEMGYSDEVIGALLNHKKRTVTGIHYNMFQYGSQKRQAIEAWERKLAAITTGENNAKVINLVR